VIASVVLVIGVGGAALKFAGIHFEVEGMALATIVGILLNLILPKPKGEQAPALVQTAGKSG
jgi:uracil permease